jgi:hypothetical protein
MSTALIRGRQARAQLPATLTIAAGRQHTAETILRAWFEGKSAHTIRAYGHDLEDFAPYVSRALGITPPMRVPDALTTLFRQSSPSAHEIVLGFRAYLDSAHFASASINRHLATLRSVTKLGRMLGLMCGVTPYGTAASPRPQNSASAPAWGSTRSARTPATGRLPRSWSTSTSAGSRPPIEHWPIWSPAV